MADTEGALAARAADLPVRGDRPPPTPDHTPASEPSTGGTPHDGPPHRLPGVHLALEADGGAHPAAQVTPTARAVREAAVFAEHAGFALVTFAGAPLPELQSRGVLRTEYRGSTLCDHLDLPPLAATPVD
ncbi:hypothetical protein [Streptomyces sp. NPDC001401]|uniref:hypothetical protein n=1 Tax=Streptomyces sp. NPDC001401 TaxID=3364570 RepID=UPI00368A4D9C